MKKTGSIRVEIVDEYIASGDSVIEIIDLEAVKNKRQVRVPKSAVTEIREEVDWSKVKLGTWVMVLSTPTTRWYVAPYGYYDPKTTLFRPSDRTWEYNVEKVMPLKDWLKEYGGQDE